MMKEVAPMPLKEDMEASVTAMALPDLMSSTKDKSSVGKLVMVQ